MQSALTKLRSGQVAECGVIQLERAVMESVFEDIIGFLFFILCWPGIIISLLLVPIGLSTKKYKILGLSSFLCLPFTYVILLYTTVALIIPTCLFGASYLAFKNLFHHDISHET